MLKYKIFIGFLDNNDMLNNNNRIKGATKFKGNSRKIYNRSILILKKLTSWLDISTSNQIRMRYVLNNITILNDKCHVCRNQLKYSDKNSKFELTCGSRDKAHLDYIKNKTQELAKESQLQKYSGWASQTPKFQEKIKKTNLEKYGETRFSKTMEFKDFMQKNSSKFNTKKIDTNLKRYGTEWATQNQEIKSINYKKTTEAIRLKYGVDHFTHWAGYPEFLKKNKDKIIQKMENTNLKRYGSKFIFGSDYQKKIMLSKYGSENYAQTNEFKQYMHNNFPSILEKIKKTSLERYGVNHYFQSSEFKQHMKDNFPSILEKIKNTNLEKYGTEYYFQSNEFKKYMKDNHMSILKKIKTTNMERYNVEHYSQSIEYKKYMKDNYDDILKRIKVTNLNKYGVEYYSQTEECKQHMRDNFPSILEKIKDTNLKKYGTEYYTQTDKFKQHMRDNFPSILKRIKATNLEKYGVENYAQTDEYKQLWLKNKDEYILNTKATSLKRYGVESYSQTGEFKDKIKINTLNKYGVESYFQTEECKLKSKSTNLEKYGVEYYTQTDKFKQHLKDNFPSILEKIKVIDPDTNLQNELRQKFITKKGHFNIQKFMQEYSCGETTAYKVIRELRIKYKKRKGTSMPEEEIIEFIKSIDPEAKIISNTKQVITPKELDIYLPDYKLAIEYNGLMFHSQGYSKFSIFHRPDNNKNIHLNKTKACEAKDIQLLHIFENEWLDPSLKIKWKSVIMNKMHKNRIRLMARKGTLRKLITPKEIKLSSSFFEENHLQGSKALGGYRYGLFFEGELLSCMTFGQSRFHKEKTFELIRFANKKGVTVMGAASKLFKAFIRDQKPPMVVSYANRRWSDGGLYKTLGFDLSHIAAPNYFYFKPGENILMSRNIYQKHKLSKKLDNFDPDLTEQENCFNHGLRRIFDSGNYVFKWTPSGQ